MSKNTQLDSSISQLRISGVSDEKIINDARIAGWADADIKASYESIGVSFPLDQSPNTSSSVVPSNTRKNIFKKLLITFASIVILYIVVGIILIMINPVFGFLVLYPYFIIQSMFGVFQNEVLESNINSAPVSSVVMLDKLIKSDCMGFFGTVGFLDFNYPGIDVYAEKLSAGKYDQIGVCKTQKGTFVTKSFYKNNGETHLNEIYLDKENEFKKVFEFEGPILEITEDSNNNIFLLTSEMIERNVSRKPYVYDQVSNTFHNIKDVPDTFDVCDMDNVEKCVTWRIRNFAVEVKAVANYSPSQQMEEFLSSNSTKNKTKDQVNCIIELTKEVKRSKDGVKDIRLLSDLNEEPLFSCVTDAKKRPYDFNIYLVPSAFRFNDEIYSPSINYAFFSSTQTRIVGYQIDYPGFVLYNYALDSMAYKVFKNIIEGKYKPGELIPYVDNTESMGFNPNLTLKSVTKITYKDVDIYSLNTKHINGEILYKAFVKGNTYVLVRYDNNLDDSKSDKLAMSIAENIVLSKPYTPVKNIPLKTEQLISVAKKQNFFEVSKEYLIKSLDIAKSYYTKNKSYRGFCMDKDSSKKVDALSNQIIVENVGFQCSENGVNNITLGIYIGDPVSKINTKASTIDQNGKFGGYLSVYDDKIVTNKSSLLEIQNSVRTSVINGTIKDVEGCMGLTNKYINKIELADLGNLLDICYGLIEKK